jgi:RNA polymerase sigma-70 factor, ECF subfamily
VQRDLVERARRGETEAFDALARLVSGRLFAVAYRILRDHYLAEDAVQQTLITIWNELPRLRDPERFDAWTYRLIVRSSVAEARRERRGGAPIQLLPEDADVSPAPDQYRAVADRDQLERGFRRLTIDQRTVVVLYHYLDKPLDEIATIIGIPTGTAHSRLHHAMRGMRAALDADARPTEREAAQ